MNDGDTDTRLAFECAALRLGQNKSEQDMLLYAADFLREIEWALLPWWKRMFRRRV